MVTMLKVNSAGTAIIVDILAVDKTGVIRSEARKNGDCFDSGSLKAIRSDSCRIKAAIAQGSFTV